MCGKQKDLDEGNKRHNTLSVLLLASLLLLSIGCGKDDNLDPPPPVEDKAPREITYQLSFDKTLGGGGKFGGLQFIVPPAFEWAMGEAEIYYVYLSFYNITIVEFDTMYNAIHREFIATERDDAIVGEYSSPFYKTNEDTKMIEIIFSVILAAHKGYGASSPMIRRVINVRYLLLLPRNFHFLIEVC